MARWALVLFVIAFALRMGVCAGTRTLGQSPQARYREYVRAADRLLTHGTLVSPLIIEDVDRRPSALLPPAYVGLVAAMYGLLGVESFAATLALQLINAAATALAAVVAYGVARSLSGPRAALIAGIVATLNPTLIGYTDYIWDTSLFALGVAATLWMAMRLGDPSFPLATTGDAAPSVSPLMKGGSFWWFGFGLWLGGLALLNPALTISYPMLVLWPIARGGSWNWSRALPRVALVVSGWVIAIAPWTVRNYAHFGEIMYVRGGLGLELWLGICPEADPGGEDVYKRQFPLNNPDVQRQVTEIGERAFIGERAGWAKEAIRLDPWRFARLSAIRAVDFWAGTTFGHAEPGPRGFTSLRRNATAGLLLAETGIVVLGLALRRRVGGNLPWLLATVLAFSLVYCITHVQLRFRTPIEPVMAVMVAVLVVGKARGGFPVHPA
jgi:hypothetical protein